MNSSTDNTEKTVSLVLGSGGARGLAHIGVIRWLQEHNYVIQSISGCSMGALVGGVYAAGKLEEFANWITAIKALDIFSLLDFSLNKAGVVRGDKVINTLKNLIGECQIEDLSIRFTAVATDLSNEREVWFDSGPLFDAIRASISLPLFFTPVTYKNNTLVDGGVLNPVPIAPTFKDHTDMTIAVNLDGKNSSYIQPVESKSENNDSEKNTVTSYFEDKANSFIRSLLSKNISSDKHAEDWSYTDVIQQSFESMQGTIARQKLAAYPPDILIEIASIQCGVMEFNRAEELIEIGYNKTAEAMSNL